MNIRRLMSGLLAGVLACTTAWPCGFEFPNSYIVFGGEADILLMPKASFSSEVRRILGFEPTVETEEDYYDYQEPWEKTLEADVQSLNIALNESQLGAERITELMTEYRALRDAMHAGATIPPVYPDEADNGDYYEPEPDPDAPAPTPVDLAAYDALLSALPQEFALYVRGAALYRAKDFAGARIQWEAVLALPQAERKYRATWAAYMLAKTNIHEDAEAASKYFDDVRALAQAGCDDPLAFAFESFGWQARLAIESGDIVTGIERFIEMAKSPNQQDVRRAHNSLDHVLGKALKSPELTQQLATAPLPRKLATAWLVAERGFARDKRVAWLDAIAALNQPAPVDNADLLAWIAYDMGETQRASDWVKLADPAASYAQWVQSKLFLREGKIEEAVAVLRSVKDVFPRLQTSASAYFEPENPHSITQAELGVLLLGRQDYVSALDLFLRGGYWMDAAYVAERVLTSKELSDYLNAQAQDAELNETTAYGFWSDAPVSRREALTYLFARKLARENKWDEALALYPGSTREPATAFAVSYRPAIAIEQPTLISIAGDWIGSLFSGRQRALDPDRASHMFKAAQVMREHGLHITGTELDPDWQVFDGMFEPVWKSEERTIEAPPSADQTSESSDDEESDSIDPATFPPALQTALSASADERTRVEATRAVPEKRFHYRYTAADLMWQSAELSPDNDLFTEQALYWGGAYLQNRDPKAADRFYKALVWRNLNMPYAKDADKLRWFPKDAPK